MENEKKEEIIKGIIHICEDAVPVIKDNYDDCRYVNINGVSFWVEDYKKYYNPILGQIFREMKLKKGFSSVYVEEFIDILVSDIIRNGIENVKKNVFIINIDIFENKFQDCVVYIPLDGIKMEVNELKLGKITLKIMDNVLVSEIADNLEKLLRNNPFYNPPDLEKSIENERKQILKYENKICAEFRMFAEEDIAVEHAFKECEKSLDLLRFSIYFFYHSDFNVSVGLDGEIRRFYHEIIAHKANFSDFKFKSELKGFLLSI